MEGGARLRLFVALPLPADTVERLAAWQAETLARAPGARAVSPENLHVTVAFLGSRPASDLEPISRELRAAAAAGARPVLSARAYRETRGVGMVVFSDEDENAGRLAADVAARLAGIGVYEPERRPWLPHVTVARFRRPPRLRLRAPDVGPVSPSDLALYTSVLRRSGAQYVLRESAPLGG